MAYEDRPVRLPLGDHIRQCPKHLEALGGDEC